MKIYDFAPSANARKVRALVYELGLTPEFVTVNVFKGEAKTPAVLAMNPNGRIPFLEDDGFILWESNAILGYLAALHPERRLLPADPRGRADVDRWLLWQAAHLGTAVGTIGFQTVVKGMMGLGGPDVALVEAAKKDFHVLCGVLETSLGTKEYVTGRLSIADFALFSQFTIAAMCGVGVDGFPAVKAWLGRMLARESVKRANADAQAALAG
jgi:glutathione S-transferase